MRVLVIGAGLAGLAAAEVLVTSGAKVTVIDAFPVPGGRVASFDVSVPVAGLTPGDVVEHGLHAWFQHYHALFGLMDRAGIPKPALAGSGIHYFNPVHGHFVIEGGPLFWLINSLRLPESIRGPRWEALGAFTKLIGALPGALADEDGTDRQSASVWLSRFGIPQPALENVFRPCLYSLTSLRLEELSALEMLRWMSKILPDPRIRCVSGGGTAAMAAPMTRYLTELGVDFRFGVEVAALRLSSEGRAELSLETAPDKTGVRHVLVPGFRPHELPDPSAFDAVVCTLPWERLRHVASPGPWDSSEDLRRSLDHLTNVHPLSIRLWFERPIEGAGECYVLCAGTLFDVMRPTREPDRYEGIHLVDALVENVETHLPELGYDRERYVEGPVARAIEARVLTDLERMFPGQISGNAVARRFVHTREGIIACRPGTWRTRPRQYIGSPSFVLAGDWTKQPWGACMEGAVRSGQRAAHSLLAGRQVDDDPHPFAEVARSAVSIFERS
jgi:15-cis-phytoene desaturase